MFDQVTSGRRSVAGRGTLTFLVWIAAFGMGAGCSEAQYPSGGSRVYPVRPLIVDFRYDEKVTEIRKLAALSDAESLFALEAYLNGLHNISTDTATALKVAELFARMGEEHLAEGVSAQGIAALRKAVVMMERLFDEPLTEHQLWRIKRALERTLSTLHDLTR